MSDKRRRFRAIRDALAKMHSEGPKGNLARHLNTLAALISGIVGSKRTNFPAIAQGSPRWGQARKPRQTLPALGQERPNRCRDVLHTFRQNPVGQFVPPSPGVGDGWQCRGTWMHRPGAGRGLQETSAAHCLDSSQG